MPKVTRFLSSLALAVAWSSHVSAVVIDFDDVVVPAGVTAQPGNLYSAQGITFSSGDMSPDFNAAIAAGNTFTLTGIQNGFVKINNANAVSGANFAGAQSLGLQDTLMAFAGPITSLSLHSDDASEGPTGQTIRLLALAATANPDEYQVLTFDEALDNATSEPGNLLSVNVPSGFAFALFQVTTEQEGFDDVTFTPQSVPEPAGWLLLASALGALGAVRRRRAVK